MENKNENIKLKFHKDMTIEQAMKVNEEVAAVLMGFGMHCLHCPYSMMETLEQAATVHGVDINLMLEKLNEIV